MSSSPRNGWSRTDIITIMREAKPILGFGPIGWVAAAVLLALSLTAATGVDVQHLYLRSIAQLIGGDWLLRYVGTIHAWHSIHLVSPAFNVISILYLVIAFRIVPTRIAWWKYMLVIVWGVFRPMTFAWHMLLVRPLIGDGFSSLSSYVMVSVLDFLTCLVLWCVTGSRMVLLISLGCTLLTLSWTWMHGYSGSMRGAWTDWLSNTVMAVGWHLCIAGVVLAWAISERRKPREGHCPNCGYDLRGMAHERCPECGAPAAQPHPAPSPRGRGLG